MYNTLREILLKYHVLLSDTNKQTYQDISTKET